MKIESGVKAFDECFTGERINYQFDSSTLRELFKALWGSGLSKAEAYAAAHKIIENDKFDPSRLP